MSIRILLVDDHEMFREGLRAVLKGQDSLQVVGESSDGRQAVDLATGPLVPHIVIMDASMPSLNGVEATRLISVRKPAVKIIALSAHKDAHYVSAMFEAGASAYVIKEAASQEIFDAIRAVNNGRKFLSPQVAGVVIDGFVGRKASPEISNGHAAQLATREREIVQLLAEGNSSKEIAGVLDISVKTVETHRRNIMRKLNIRSVAALTKYAIREGLTSTEG